MAIKIAGTTVINDSRQLQNIASLDSTTETTIENAVTGASYTKAWVHVTGTGTVTLNASAGVSSVSDEATGRYGITFSSAFADTNYSCNTTGGGVGDDLVNSTPRVSTTPTTTNIITQMRRVGSIIDIPTVQVSVNR